MPGARAGRQPEGSAARSSGHTGILTGTTDIPGPGRPPAARISAVFPDYRDPPGRPSQGGEDAGDVHRSRTKTRHRAAVDTPACTTHLLHGVPPSILAMKLAPARTSRLRCSDSQRIGGYLAGPGSAVAEASSSVMEEDVPRRAPPSWLAVSLLSPPKAAGGSRRCPRRPVRPHRPPGGCWPR